MEPFRSNQPSPTAMLVIRAAAPLKPSRGHHCLHELWGEKCPGLPACTSAHEQQDGVRCSRCGRWAENAQGLNHADRLCSEETRPLRGRRKPARIR